MRPSRLAPAALAVYLAAAPLAAQEGSGLKSRIPDLFRFGDCPEPLCLNASVSSATGHGDHYIGSTVAGTDNLLGFLSGAIAVAVANVPISAATSGVAFRFEGGRPVRTAVSAGPIFGERVQTLGRGRFLAGVNLTATTFQAVRGVPLENLAFTFTHQNVCRTNPAWVPGTPCPGFAAADTALGSPSFENDVIEVNTSIDFDLQVASLFLTFGLLDRVDLGVAVPLVRVDLRGGSIARVVPFSFPTPHFFGTAANPSLASASSIDDNATGIGDVAARLKVNLGGTDRGAFGFLADVRFPTGNEDDFLGTGEFAVRGLAILSGRFGSFSPHLNGGYLYRAGNSLTDAVLATAGFDQLVSPSVTLAVDFISQWEVGDNPLVLPGPVTFTAPTLRRVRPTSIPNRRDHIVDASLGFKFLTGRGLTLVTNALIPLNDGGMRGDWAGTLGAEYAF
ncbi:MAG TPA: hypothetical protein VNJ71_11210 [Gemmatimonadales bacterium]|jgi:hypothetical protein|nr:hypothetical protein [Gemmatimonadales bacterium]